LRKGSTGQHGRSIAVNQKEKKRTEVIFQVRQGYYQYLLAKEMLQLLKEAETGPTWFRRWSRSRMKPLSRKRGKRDDPDRLSEVEKFSIE